eukprot:gene2417-2650_t
METLTSMGFEASQAELALKRCSGDVARAIDLLLGGGDLSDVSPSSQGRLVPGDSIGGEEQIRLVMELGVSQYTFAEAGASACTVIASAAMKHLLEELSVNPSREIDVDRLSNIVTEGVIQFAQLNLGGGHLAVDELDPSFFGTVKQVPGGLLQGILTESHAFTDLFHQIRQLEVDPRGYIGVVLTKPPETVAFLLPPLGQSRHFFFDSHSRPQWGIQAAYLVECEGEEGIEFCLRRVLSTLPFSAFGSSDPSAMMYDMFEASIFQI